MNGITYINVHKFIFMTKSSSHVWHIPLKIDHEIFLQPFKKGKYFLSHSRKANISSTIQERQIFPQPFKKGKYFLNHSRKANISSTIQERQIFPQPFKKGKYFLNHSRKANISSTIQERQIFPQPFKKGIYHLVVKKCAPNTGNLPLGCLTRNGAARITDWSNLALAVDHGR